MLGVTLVGGLHLALSAAGRHGRALTLPPALLTAVLLLAGSVAARRATRPAPDTRPVPAGPEVVGSRP
ncbi:hypothetical protein B0E53_03498 [Micromonospora sp. MH33]|nr:hypothetical protein B0E53_03498 [Micromonospora sp. MH33]